MNLERNSSERISCEHKRQREIESETHDSSYISLENVNIPTNAYKKTRIMRWNRQVGVEFRMNYQIDHEVISDHNGHHQCVLCKSKTVHKCNMCKEYLCQVPYGSGHFKSCFHHFHHNKKLVSAAGK